MRVWRVCRSSHPPFDGEGARRHGGRWNLPGRPMVYTSATLSLAVLELLANLSKDQAPDDLVTVPADLPDDLPVRALEPAALPRDWRSYPAPRALAELGSRWLEKAETAVLAVPSAIIPGERNWLLNPAHPDFRRIRAGRAEPFRFDPRLWR